MKHLLATTFILIAATAAAAQFGSVRGQITIKQVSGNNLGDFGCSNISVSASGLGKGAWSRSVGSHGKFSDRVCEYSLPRVPANVPFTVTLAGNFPRGCDLKVFKSDSSFPMTVKSRGSITFNPTIQQITCTIVK